MSHAPVMLPICACIVARDAEQRIGDAIRSVDFVREIVLVIDDRTRDGTAAAAARAAGPGQALHIVRRPWAGHVEQKNYALEQAGAEWVLCLDADERVSAELRRETLALFESGPARDGYSFPRRTRFLGRWIRHGGWHPDRKLRLFRRRCGRWGGFDPHDRVELDGARGELRAELLHLGSETLREHFEKMDAYAGIAARSMKERGRRGVLAGLLVRAPAKFVKMFFLRGGFRDGAAGLVLALCGASYVWLKYAKLWELREDERRSREHGAVGYRLQL
jgi:glycosyltransferase involved in cell wall biosynthesis